jgi:hypothetical protein
MIIDDLSGNSISRLDFRPAKVSRTVTAENQFTPWLHLGKDQSANVSVGGTFSATVSLQIRLAGESSANSVKTYTTAAEEVFITGGNCDIRLGVATGAYTSGAPVLILDKSVE